jgi:uncharacterized protein (DUF2236 family)
MAHPLVARGVADHSSFNAGRLSAFRRLHDTVGAMRAIAFGDHERREAVLEGIRRIHDRVHGMLPEAAGPYPGGARYSAHDPDLLLWVHLTLIESVVLLHDRLVEPLDDQARDEYCRSAAPVAIALGARADDVPTNWSRLQQALSAEYASGRIVVTGTARGVGHLVLWPPMGWITWPGTAINRLVTIGMLPAVIRDAYGFRWQARDERRLERTVEWIRRLRRITPEWMALWPEARAQAWAKNKNGMISRER